MIANKTLSSIGILISYLTARPVRVAGAVVGDQPQVYHWARKASRQIKTFCEKGNKTLL